ncbi:pol protein [Cucumis melo var. makuwa]|uniref:Pol protein n=1 Tax=Cucumis melo var. makuwa TaxID=1194695 RepID=A0A5D3C3K3_CUCMM|nr:pol protein [Cucumis melo var. makuwa]
MYARGEAEKAGTVVIGMDWLSDINANIDCSCNEVVFNLHTKASFKYKGARIMVLPKVILAMKASKLLNQESSGEVSVDLAKINVVTSWPQPSTISEVRSFMGLTGKMNVVADALSRKVSHSIALITRHALLHRDIERAVIAASVEEAISQLAQLSMQPTFRQKIIVAQLNCPYLATSGMTPFEALYGNFYRSPVCWGEVAPMKGALRFEKKGKLSPCFVGPFKILERIDPVAY